MKKKMPALFLSFLLILSLTGTLMAGQDSEASPQGASMHERLGDSLFRQGKAGEALLEWEKALRIDPAMAPVWLKLGNLYWERGLREKSLYYLEEEAKLSPGYAPGLFMVGLAHYSLGHGHEATKWLSSAILKAPRSGSLPIEASGGLEGPSLPAAKSAFLLASLAAREGDLKRAGFLLSRSLFSPRELFLPGTGEARAAAFRSAMAGSPCTSFFAAGKGERQVFTDTGLELVKNDELRATVMAWGEDDERPFYEKALNEGGDSIISVIEALSWCSLYHERQGDIGKAREMAGEALKRQPLNAFLNFNVGYLLAREGSLTAARPYFEKALGLCPPLSSWGPMNLLRSRSLLFLGLGAENRREALRLLRESLGGDPSRSYEAYLPLAELLRDEDRGNALIYLFEFLRASTIPTGKALDGALAGTCLVRVWKDGRSSLTRTASFTLRQERDLVTPEGYSTGIIIPGGTSDLALTPGGDISGMGKDGARVTVGTLTVVEVDEIEALRPVAGTVGTYHDMPRARKVPSPGLLPFHLNKPALLIRNGELRGWALLKTLAPSAPGLMEAFNGGLADKWTGAETLGESPTTGPGCFPRYYKARAALARGDYEGARRELSSLMGGGNEIVCCLFRLFAISGQGYQRASIAREALEEVGRGLSVKPAPAGLLFLRAWALEKSGDGAAALKAYEAFLESANASERETLPLTLRALIAGIRGKPDFALMETLMPGHPGYIEDLYARSFSPGTAYPQGKDFDMLNATGAERIIYAHGRRGALLLKMKEYEKAIEAYRKGIALRSLENPAAPVFISGGLIMALFNAGRLDEVRNELDLMSSNGSYLTISLARLYTILGDAFRERGEKAKAGECYTMAGKILEHMKGDGLR
ncbi:MAG: tetratricopeptide repeat protein [Candidatus Eremiobacteraeota bacterium]|nr:tetratricopeptide repeat protein [Candidatus Eremiobacteraeota bacterium]